VREPLERVDRVWRGMVMDTYALEKLTGWTPELSPPPDSPLYRPRVLAGDIDLRWRVAALKVIPGRVEDANPESRDSPVRNCVPEVWSFGPSRTDEVA
jgi:hypothetical protein